jgi:hypothetical protein
MEVKFKRFDIENLSDYDSNINILIYGKPHYREPYGSIRIYFLNNENEFLIILKLKKLIQNSTTCECCRRELVQQQCQNNNCRLYSPIKD